jgi:hypothetical protein
VEFSTIDRVSTHHQKNQKKWKTNTPFHKSAPFIA